MRPVLICPDDLLEHVVTAAAFPGERPLYLVSRASLRARLARRGDRAMAAQVARAQARLKDSVNRLSQTLLSARSRKEAAQQIAQARQSVKASLDRLGQTLGESQKKVTREVGLLTRGLKAGVKAGRAAYRGPRR